LDIGTHYFQQVALATGRYEVSLKTAEGCGQNLKLYKAMACDFLRHNLRPLASILLNEQEIRSAETKKQI